MTDKRFKLNPMSDNRGNIWYGLFDSKELSYICDTWKGSERCCRLLNDLNDENEQLKTQNKMQEEVIIDAIDSLMNLPSVTSYLLRQWLDAMQEFDSIEDMKKTFSERVKELEEWQR